MPNVLKLLVTADTKQSQKALRELGGQMQTIGGGMQSVGKSMMALGVAGAAGLLMLAKATGEADVAHVKLSNTIENMPKLQGANIAKFDEQAAAIARVTAADDDAVTSGQAMLGTFQITQAQLLGLMPLVVDYARKFKVDIPDAAKQVGKAMDGQIGALKRNGVSIDANLYKTDRYAAIQLALRQQVGGFAAKEAKTFPGAVEHMTNSLENLAETAGGPVADDLAKLADTTARLAADMEDASKQNPQQVRAWTTVAEAASGFLIVGGGLIWTIGKLTDTAGGFMIGLTKVGGLLKWIGAVAAPVVLPLGAIAAAFNTAGRMGEEGLGKAGQAFGFFLPILGETVIGMRRWRDLLGLTDKAEAGFGERTRTLHTPQTQLKDVITKKGVAAKTAAEHIKDLAAANLRLRTATSTAAGSRLAEMDAEDQLTESKKKLAQAEKDYKHDPTGEHKRALERAQLQMRVDAEALAKARAERLKAQQEANKAKTTMRQTIVETERDLNRLPLAGAKAGRGATSSLASTIAAGKPGAWLQANSLGAGVKTNIGKHVNAANGGAQGRSHTRAVGSGVQSPDAKRYAVGAASTTGRAVLNAFSKSLFGGKTGLGAAGKGEWGPYTNGPTGSERGSAPYQAGARMAGEETAKFVDLKMVPQLKPLLDLGLTVEQALSGTGPANFVAGLKRMMGAWGKPYVWGASGPDAFDCSGLVSWVMSAIFPGRYGRLGSGEWASALAPGPGKFMTVGWHPGHVWIADLLGHRGEARTRTLPVLSEHSDPKARGLFGGSMFHISGFATGGMVYRPTLAMLGEGRDPVEGVFTREQMKHLQPRGGAISVDSHDTYIVRSDADIDRIATLQADRTTQALRAAGVV